MSTLPHWANKPAHKQKVIATSRGWVVEETGEMLKRVNDLPAKLEALLKDADVIRDIVKDIPEDAASEPVVEASPEPSLEDEKVEDVVTNTDETENTETSSESVEEVETKPRRGRKKKEA